MISSNKIKRLVIFTSVMFALLFSIVALPFSTSATEENNGSSYATLGDEWEKLGDWKLDNGYLRIRKAARYIAIIDVMSKCVDRVSRTFEVDEEGMYNGGVGATIFNSDKDSSFVVGPWLEEYITGEYDNGYIQCSDGNDEYLEGYDGIVHDFAIVLYGAPNPANASDWPRDRWWENILCNDFDHDYPGLIGPRIGDIGVDNLGCMDAIDGNNLDTESVEHCYYPTRPDGSTSSTQTCYTINEDRTDLGYTTNVRIGYHPRSVSSYNSAAEVLSGYPVYSDGREYLDAVLKYWKDNQEWEQNDNFEDWGMNEYLPDSLDQASHWSGTDYEFVWHYVYSLDFDTYCGYKPSDPTQPNTVAYFRADQDTGAGYKQYIVLDSDNPSGIAIQGKKYPNNDGYDQSCKDILSAMNKSFGSWYEAIREANRKYCDKDKNKLDKVWKYSYIKSRLITGEDGDSGKPLILGPDGTKYYVDKILAQDPDNQTYLSQEQMDGWDMKWSNYDINPDTGEPEIREFSDESIATAKEYIEKYNKIQANIVNGQVSYLINTSEYQNGMGNNQYPEGDIGFYATYFPYECAVPKQYDIDSPQPLVSSDDDDSSADSDPCYDAGVEGMSWVLCPAINNTSNTVDKIEELLRGWLTIPVDGKDGIYAQAKDSNGKEQEGTYVGWDIFRNIANVFLAILFLFIIFSQLTGYGIDNYGIKKMLPKLIAIAIIINLSYILCKIAVDVSNILGVGLNNLFETIGRGIASAGQKDMNYTTSTIVGVLFGAIAGTGTVAGIALSAAGGGWVMVVVVLLLALLVALVGVLIFFVMLSVRIIIVAVFIVLAPLALACYILPNTKSLFQKWWKVFEAALLVFPICGALYGASFIVKAIVGGDGAAGSWTFMGAIAAVIAPFLPFFALPSLLKGALAGLGAIGGTLTALGGSLKKGAQSGSNAIQSGIKGTERYKNNMQERARSRQAKLTNRGIEKLENRQKKLAGKGKSLSAGEQQLLARRYQTKDKLENEDRAARTVVEQNRTSDMDLDGLMKEWNNAWNGGDSKKLDAMTSVINSRYGASGASQIANSLADKDVASDEQAQSMMGILQNNMNHDSTFANNMRNKAADAYSMISDGGRVREKNGKFAYKNLDHFTKSQTAAEKDKDWATQSKDTIRRAIKEGKLGKEQIERMLYDTNPNIQSELNGDGKRGVLEEALKDMGGPSSTTPSSTSGGIITADSLEGRQEIERQRKKGRII